MTQKINEENFNKLIKRVFKLEKKEICSYLTLKDGYNLCGNPSIINAYCANNCKISQRIKPKPKDSKSKSLLKRTIKCWKKQANMRLQDIKEKDKEIEQLKKVKTHIWGCALNYQKLFEGSIEESQEKRSEFLELIKENIYIKSNTTNALKELKQISEYDEWINNFNIDNLIDNAIIFLEKNLKDPENISWYYDDIARKNTIIEQKDKEIELFKSKIIGWKDRSSNYEEDIENLKQHILTEKIDKESITEEKVHYKNINDEILKIISQFKKEGRNSWYQFYGMNAGHTEQIYKILKSELKDNKTKEHIHRWYDAGKKGGRDMQRCSDPNCFEQQWKY